MEQKLKLRKQPFQSIKNGKKRVELRLYDEKRKGFCVGDDILFTNIETGEELRAKIWKLQKFLNFFELYSAFDKEEIGYRANEIANPEDMYAYYSKEEIEKYGVIAICITLL